MAGAKRVQFAKELIGWVAAALVLALLFSPGAALFEPAGNDTTHPAIKSSAIFVVWFWCFGWLIVFARGSPARGVDELPVRPTWAVGCLLLLAHIGIAFHTGHGWSHQAAWDHTKQTGGYGDGIYVNYAFALVWLADAVWACVAFGSYRARPRWLNGTIHGFLAFIMFNAAVVFGRFDSRVAFAFLFSVSLIACVARMRPRERNSA